MDVCIGRLIKIPQTMGVGAPKLMMMMMIIWEQDDEYYILTRIIGHDG